MSAAPYSKLPFRQMPDVARHLVVDADDLVVASCDTRDILAGNPRRVGAMIEDAAFIAAACTAHPLLVSTIQTAAHALRSYQYGNASPDLAREIADACEVVLAQMEGR